MHGIPDEDEYFSDEYPSASNSHWVPWLQKQLLMRGYDAQTPEMFESYRPHYDTWRREFERHLVDEPMTLVGHSCGAGFLVRWLSENRVTARKVVLVAPWLDPDREDTTDFFDFTIDHELPTRTDELHLLHSTDDFASVGASVALLEDAWPSGVQHHRWPDRGHFTDRNIGPTFPELLELVIRAIPSSRSLDSQS